MSVYNNVIFYKILNPPIMDRNYQNQRNSQQNYNRNRRDSWNNDSWDGENNYGSNYGSEGHYGGRMNKRNYPEPYSASGFQGEGGNQYGNYNNDREVYGGYENDYERNEGGRGFFERIGDGIK